MEDPVLSVPVRQKSVGPIEVYPKQARAWLAALPIANSLEAARKIYRSLYALNRNTLTVQDRLELMELYRNPLAAACAGLQVHFSKLALPLTPKKKQLADFLRQLQVEMAYGYKYIIRDYINSRYADSKKEWLNLAIGRAIYYLGEVLLRSYQVYMPCPVGVWKEIHSLYAYAESNGGQHSPIVSDGDKKTTIAKQYQQVLLLGLCGPYQLPPNECRQVNAFLDVWAEKAVIGDQLEIPSAVGHFLIDLSVDSPPFAFPRDIKLQAAPHLRVLNAIGLAGIVHAFVTRLQRGEPVKAPELGMEYIGSASLDILRRMVRFWGLKQRRQFSRTKKQGSLSICVGLNALHFFYSGQKPFAVSAPAVETMAEAGAVDDADMNDLSGDKAYVDLDNIEQSVPLKTDSVPQTQELFRIDQWQIKDESAGGFLLVRSKESGGIYVRIGDLLGIQDRSSEEWRIGLVRWLKNPEATTVEIGVEMLAPGAEPVALRGRTPAYQSDQPMPGLLLPAMPFLRRPATLLAAWGTYQPGGELYITKKERGSRLVHLVKLLERTGSFEHIVFTDRNVIAQTELT